MPRPSPSPSRSSAVRTLLTALSCRCAQRLESVKIAVRPLREAVPGIGVKSLLGKLELEQLGATSREVREAVRALEDEAAAAEAAAAAAAAAAEAHAKRKARIADDVAHAQQQQAEEDNPNPNPIPRTLSLSLVP